jgi:CcmD family protein
MTDLTYGLIAAWIILVGYVLTLANRDRQLRREIAHIKAMLESGQANPRG